jgi:hypothetical protein
MEMHHRNPDRKEGEHKPQAYLITWHCYGTWFPGQLGAVPRTQNRFNSPLPEVNAYKECHARDRTRDAPYALDDVRRKIVLDRLLEVCCFRR